MKRLLIIPLLLIVPHLSAQDTISFENPKQMTNYAFSNTASSGLSSSYLIDRTLDIEENAYNHYLHGDTNLVKGVNNLHLFTLLEWWDMNQKFQRDSVLYPIYNHFYTMDNEKELHIPLFVVDLDVIKIKKDVWTELKNERGSTPFRSIYQTDVINNHIETASVFLDSFAYNKVFLDFNSSTFFSNRSRKVVEINLQLGNSRKQLVPGTPIDISEWVGQKGRITLRILFDDSTTLVKSQDIIMQHSMVPKSLNTDWTNGVLRQYLDSGLPTTIENPEAKYSIYHGCSDRKLRKPFIMVAGWGPHTDKSLINNNQGWPTPLWKLAEQFNQEGLIENLHDQGFDVVLVQFNPPNASIIKNSALLEKVINHVNTMKFENNSFEENILMGFSAGALASKLALQQMEKKHLEQNGPHPHTKLFISNDGENGGANVPLGMQHAVKYLWQYEYNNFPTDYNTYALHYILNAPLSKELLYYFHSATGSGDSPGQGPDPMRTGYLQYHDWNNHAKNTHLPGYPSFQRNISISNGSSTPDYNFSNYYSNHYPYPSEPGAYFFKQHGSLMGWVNRNFGATFLKHGIHRVFYYEFKPLFKAWRVRYEAKTNNPLVVDNAPGGIIFIEQNPIIAINNELQSELTGAPDILQDHLFSFTPTVLTHDVKNLNAHVVDGYPNYNFKENKLMYDDEFFAIINNPSFASNFYGYPHLGYPSNHYDYVPFDALFCWNENTEHLIGNKKSSSYYAGEWSAMKPVLKNFVVEEAEGWNIFLQNRQLGFYTRAGYTFRVDFEAENGIYLGNHVTQKTDFKNFSSETNAVVEAQAGKEIIFKPGVHLKAGTYFHAFIGDIACEKALFTSDAPSSDGEMIKDLERMEIRQQQTNDDDKPHIYPNPNNGSFKIRWETEHTNTPLMITILDLYGKEVFKTDALTEHEIQPGLLKGYYIIVIQKENRCYTEKIIVSEY